MSSRRTSVSLFGGSGFQSTVKVFQVQAKPDGSLRASWNSAINDVICIQIYTIILLKSVCLSVLVNCRSQFLLDHLGRCFKLFISTDSISSHEFASQFGVAFCFYSKTTQKLSRRPTLTQVPVEQVLNEKGRNAGHGRSITSDQPERQEHKRLLWS